MIERVARFIADPESEPFEALAADVCRDHGRRGPEFRERCERAGLGFDKPDDWRRAPFAGDSPAAAVDARLQRAAIGSALAETAIAAMGRPPVLSLVEPSSEAPGSSPALTAELVAQRYGGEPSVVAAIRGRLDARALRSWLAARQRAGQPALIVATRADLAALLDALDRLDLRFRLAAGSRLLTPADDRTPEEPGIRDLEPRLGDRLGLALESAIDEYAHPALATRFYTGTGEGARLFRPPRWTRVRILDESQAETAPGEAGRIAVFDLAGVGSALHVLTEGRGVAADGGFRLLSRDG